MFSSIKSSACALLLLASAITATPLATRATDTAGEVYFLTNCYDTDLTVQRAEIDYYANATLAGQHGLPTTVSVINTESTLDYEDGTWIAVTPVNIVIFIGEDAYTATPDSKVGSGTAGTQKLNCERISRDSVYTVGNVTCTADYACYDK